jgi:biotin carboxyl carrier protein
VDFAAPADGSSRPVVTIDGRCVDVDVTTISPGVYSILIEGRSFEVRIEPAADGMLVHTSQREFRLDVLDPRSWRRSRAGKVELDGRQEIVASMPGKIVRLLVETGQGVEAGQGLMVVEAMKMQNEVSAPKSGIVEQILVKEGQPVGAGEVLAIIA